MLVSVKSLRKLVDLGELSAQDIALKLTFAGIEVEEVTRLASGTNLVIGEILECVDHPDSDHLHVLKVDLGNTYGIEQIVCGAPNARKGLKVIVARVGAKLPDGTISKGKIRGVESNGMCCSLLELGVASKFLNEKQTTGIEELDPSAPVGEEDVLARYSDGESGLAGIVGRRDSEAVYICSRGTSRVQADVVDEQVSVQKLGKRELVSGGDGNDHLFVVFTC